MTIRRFSAEAIGTFMLVFFGTSAIVFSPGASLLSIAFAFAAAVGTGIFMFGMISGGHFNPAVSLAMFLDQRLSLKAFITDLVAQLSGALLGTFMVYLFMQTDSTFLGSTIPSTMLNDFESLVFEIILTFVLVFVILFASTKKDLKPLMGLIVPLALIALILAGGPSTGASMNPARSIAPALFEGGRALAVLWIYLLGPLVGSLLAFGLFKLMTKPL
jgi:aquaporin Z